MDLYLGFVILEGLLALAVVGTNLLVCATICLHRELRSVTNCLVACLALADLGVGALAIPFSVVLSLELTLCFHTCLFLACFPLVTTQFSILLLLLIALNAHLKIRLPSRQEDGAPSARAAGQGLPGVWAWGVPQPRGIGTRRLGWLPGRVSQSVAPGGSGG